MKALAALAFGFVCWVVGHVQGQQVGLRDVLDADPEPEPVTILTNNRITSTSPDIRVRGDHG